MDRTQSSGLTWRKSRYSGTDDNCVEVASLTASSVAVRDSKDPAGPTLRVAHHEWAAFIGGLKGNELI
ncbi:hypothetical protein Skr01_46980 [Sphaerisporangium krabiense]|uniref:DUF397 domain-containing protein n=1 Tax=Sphaerisporangium krabiense TaxID=763782 RepID=A0A7W8Z541_9ACTN|nr:DUF397 domain-containing protein [Sphaerisporangium krabiense]MBB5627253.1 hypothetical protein [Sphaerisporangium krabiense]GII64613.1 hypothetical protein Skr01_46980 [Sphaerisporangium krabiense]